jgi:pilus assembly protein Flp/PilA
MFFARIQQFLQVEEAATAAEYAVLLALILLALISAITTVGNSTSGLWQNDVNRISTASGGGG